MRDRDFEGGKAWATPLTESDGQAKAEVSGGFDRPLERLETVEVYGEPATGHTFDASGGPNELRANIIAKAAAEARLAYDHWIEAVSFLRIVEPGADRQYGSVTKELHDAAAYMEAKE